MRRLITVYTVCLGMSVSIFWVNAVYRIIRIVLRTRMDVRKFHVSILIFCLINNVISHEDNRSLCRTCSGSKGAYQCGDGKCCCTGEWACCVYTNLTAIPKFADSITSLDFSHNYIKSVSPETFINITDLKIKTLKLRHCGIRYISGDSFRELRYIQELVLEGNENINQSQLSKSFFKIQREQKIKISLDGCGLKEIPDDFFRGFQNARVKYLSLRKNRMEEYNEIPFQYLTRLTKLDLSSNWIKNISKHRVGHATMEYINLSDNEFTTYPPFFCNKNSTSLYPNLEYLDLSRNVITVPVRKAWSCLTKLKELSLRRNVLKVIQDDVFSDLVSLDTLHVSHMASAIKQIYPRSFNITRLRHLHFSHNYLTFKPHSYIQFEKLFMYLPNLESLHLGSNDLDLDNATFVQMLEPLTKLQHLYLDNANLRWIPENLLNRFQNLTKINLGKNKIAWIDPSAFTKVTNLQRLYLYENRIVEITPDSLPNSVRQSLEKVNLADNPFICNQCRNMWFRNWITNSRITFRGWPYNYSCYNPPSMRGKLFQEYNPKPGDCKQKDPLIIVCTVIGIFLIIVIIVGTAGYRGRWYIRYWIIRFRWRCKRPRDDDSERQSLLQNDALYDAYVIYNDSDRRYVRETLLPFMEDIHGYKMFIRDREHVQGAKVDIMVDSIYKSNHVIAIISRNFLKDQWCEFQLAVTIDRQVDLKRNFLLLVTLEDIDKSLLNKSWCVLLTKTPTAEWCDKKNDIRRKLSEHQLTTIISHRNSPRRIRSQTNESLSD